MKKNLFRIAALVLVGACMTACSSGDDEATNEKVNPQENKDNIVTLTGKIAVPVTTRSTVDENTGRSTWTAGDKIAVIYQNKFGSWSKAVGTISTGGNETSEFTVTLTNPVNCNAKLVYPADNATTSAPYYTTSTLSTQNGTLAEIGTKHNIQSTEENYALVISGENATLNDGAAVQLANRVCITKFTLEYSDNSVFNASKLVVTGGGNTYTINPPAISNEFYVALPAINGELTIKATGPTKFENTTALVPSSVTTADYGKFIVVNPAETNKAYLAERTTSNEWTKTFSGASLAEGNFYKNTISFNSYVPVAVIAHVGAIKGNASGSNNAYCDNFLALALEDVYSGVKTIGEAQALIGSSGWCSSHAIKIGTDTYSSLVGSTTGKYDEVQECAQKGGTGDDKYKIDAEHAVTSAPRTDAVDKGWRIPSVTDLRYIFESLKTDGATGTKVMSAAVTPTSPIGIMDHNGQYYSNSDNSSYSNGASLRTPINKLCGNNYLESQYYWLSSQVISTGQVLQDTKAWRFSFNFNYFIWNEQADKSLARLVFAY